MFWRKLVKHHSAVQEGLFSFTRVPSWPKVYGEDLFNLVKGQLDLTFPLRNLSFMYT